jgi:hypothetical protein
MLKIVRILANILATVVPHESASAVHFVCAPRAHVGGPVFPFEKAMTVLETVFVAASVDGSVGPTFFALVVEAVF